MMHRSTPRAARRAATVIPVVLLAACGGAEGGPEWAGTVDTLPSGRVLVQNPAEGRWAEGEAWTLTEELRIGSLDSQGPDMFGSLTDVAVDELGRIWAFEGQAQELRVFGPDGSHVRTVGRQGEGPGEFAQVIGMEWGPDGRLWVVDPNNNRISVVDTTGAFVDSHTALGGVTVIPWPGGFDARGRFYTYGIDPDAEDFSLVMVRHDRSLTPVDSVAPPRYEGEQEFFEISRGTSRIRMTVPFSPGVNWRISDPGGFWALHTGDYTLHELTWEGDTLRTATRAYEPLPVTSQDIDRAIERMEWFIDQGGKVDRSRFPDVQPAARNFFRDDSGHLWVRRVVADPALEGRRYDVFDREGVFLGEVTSPVSLESSPAPIVREGYLYGVTEDELEVPWLVRLEVEFPAT